MRDSQLELLRDDFKQIVRACGSILDDFSHKDVLVTGASGFLGSYMLDFLAYLNDEHVIGSCHVFAVDNYIMGNNDRIKHLRGRQDMEFIEGDICRFATMESFRGLAAYAFHMASIASPIFYKQYPIETARVNTQGIWNILENLTNAASIVYFSSSEVYGDPDSMHIPTKEDYWGYVSCNGPRSCYDESKRFGETLCSIYHHEHAMPIKVVRPSNVYGPGMNLNDGRIIPNMMRALSIGEPLPIFGSGLATRSYVYASDFLSQLLFVTLRGENGSTYNLGNDSLEISVQDLAKLGQTLFGERLQVAHIGAEKELIDAPNRRLPDVTKVCALVGHEPQVGLSQGLERTWRYYA